MAFTKRTWLARIGTGLNKFIIGEKDANDKQTLTNSPDSVTQQGDVISADNLNDLEDRIEAEFTSQDARINAKADTSYVNGMKLTKLWENSSPNSVFAAQTITVNESINNIIIEYMRANGDSSHTFRKVWARCEIGDSFVTSLQWINMYVAESAAIIENRARACTITVGQNTTTFAFSTCTNSRFNSNTGVSIVDSTALCIPLAIYKADGMYNS